MKQETNTPATPVQPTTVGEQPQKCPVCGSGDIRKDFDSPDSMLCCDSCGSDFLIDGEVICNARIIDRPEGYKNYSEGEISGGNIPLDYPEWEKLQSKATVGELPGKIEQGNGWIKFHNIKTEEIGELVRRYNAFPSLLEFIKNEDNHTEGEQGNSCIDVEALINFINNQ